MVIPMKTVRFYEYGDPEVLTVEQTPEPDPPSSNEVLVDVRAIGVNPVDWRYRNGQLKWYDWFNSFPRVPGSDLAGIVQSTGNAVQTLQKNDRVYGMLTPLDSGTYTERLNVPDDTITLMPENVTFTEAAGLPLVALTSLQALRDKAQLSGEEHVLINGASGGVGTTGLQIAKNYGCSVTGVCSHRNIDLVQSLGADEVIDYTEEDFADRTDAYDVVFDAVGNRSLAKVRNCLQSEGTYVTTDIRLGRLFDQFTSLLWPGPKADVVVVQPDAEDLDQITEWVENGSVEPIVDRTYSLEEAANAHRYSETRRATGKIILEP